MVLNFDDDLQKSLDKIELTKYHQFVVHKDEEKRELHNTDKIVEKHGQTKWQIIDLLNDTYNTNFCLSNWLNNNEDDVSHFLNETGSNVLSYSEFKAPFKFHLWLGDKGFIIGVEQKGLGFNAERVHNLRLKENEGAAFEFFRSCHSKIFFDDKNNSRIVFMEYLF